MEVSNYGSFKLWKFQIMEVSDYGDFELWKFQIMEVSNYNTVYYYILKLS